jgi:hypothetical protein
MRSTNNMGSRCPRVKDARRGFDDLHVAVNSLKALNWLGELNLVEREINGLLPEGGRAAALLRIAASQPNVSNISSALATSDIAREGIPSLRHLERVVVDYPIVWITDELCVGAVSGASPWAAVSSRYLTRQVEFPSITIPPLSPQDLCQKPVNGYFGLRFNDCAALRLLRLGSAMSEMSTMCANAEKLE